MNPFEWLRQWCIGDSSNRGAELDVVNGEHARAELHYNDRGELRYVTGVGRTFDDAIIAAKDQLPVEVRR
jgi:hypothetical protein